MAAACPSCWSKAVSWRGSYYICKKCEKWHHYNPCFFCGHDEMDFSPGWAACCECDWTGEDPYDLLEVDDDEDDDA